MTERQAAIFLGVCAAVVIGGYFYVRSWTTDVAVRVAETKASEQAEEAKQRAEAKRSEADEKASLAIRIRLCEANPRSIAEVSALLGKPPVSCEGVHRQPGWYRVAWSEWIYVPLMDFGKDAAVPRCDPTERIDASKFCPAHYTRGKGWDEPCGFGGPPDTPCPKRPTYDLRDANPQ